MKPILAFLARFLLIAALSAPFWLLAAAPAYDQALLPVINALIVPENYKAFLVIGPETEQWLKDREKSGRPFVGFSGLAIRWASRTTLFCPPAPASAQAGAQPLSPLSLSTLTFNIVPLIALFLATGGVPWRRRFKRLLFAIPLIAAAHLLHIYLDYFKIQHEEVQVNVGTFAGYVSFYWVRVRYLLQGFMEQAGSMLMPFFLWLLFYQDQALAGLRRAASPEPSSPPEQKSA